MNEFDRIAGDIIKQKRRILRLTQTQLGERVGLACSTIACYELGLRGMSLDIFFKFCEVLDLNPTDVQKEIEERMGL